MVKSSIDFRNSTDLSSDRLLALCSQGLDGWSVGRITLRVRYSRGADFSGTCIYGSRRVYINLGRHLKYPYMMSSNLAKVRSTGRGWTRPLYSLELKDGYEVALFVFMHELYHLLVKQARRNTRQKESMCDRFAARHLIEQFQTSVWDEGGHPVLRELWDFQDIDGFVGAARQRLSQQRQRIVRANAAQPRVSFPSG